MAIIPEEIRCDHLNCGATRRQVNHWIAVEVKNFEAGRRVSLYDWDEAVAEGKISECSHFCGMGHAAIFVSEVMKKQ